MEDKDQIIKQQAARIRELETECDRWQGLCEYRQKEIYKLYARGFWQRVFNMIPD